MKPVALALSLPGLSRQSRQGTHGRTNLSEMAGKSLAKPGHDSAAGDGIAKALSILQESHMLRAPVSYSAKSPPINIRILTSAMPKTANIINMYVSFIATNVDRY